MQRIREVSLMIVLLCLVPPSDASGQGISSQLDGRIRIVTADAFRQGPIFPKRQALIGNLQRLTSDSVTLAVPSGGVIAVPRSTVLSVETSRGESRWRSAAQLGLLYGALAALTAYSVNADSRSDRMETAAVYGGGVGAAGALVGALMPYEHWKRISDK